MKKLSVTALTLAIFLSTGGMATAHQSIGVNGLLLGGAGGAIVGQAIAGNTEGVIVGSLIGGTLGMLIDIDSARPRVVVVDQPHYPSHVGYAYRIHRDHRHEQWKPRRHDQRWRSERWERRR